MSEAAFYRYWGKAGDEGRYHLLPYHCLDVAACGRAEWFCYEQGRELVRQAVPHPKKMARDDQSRFGSYH